MANHSAAFFNYLSSLESHKLVYCSSVHLLQLSFHLQYHTSNPLSIHPSAYIYMYLHSARENAQLKQKLQDMVQEHTRQVCNFEYTTKASVMPCSVLLEPRRKQPWL